MPRTLGDPTASIVIGLGFMIMFFAMALCLVTRGGRHRIEESKRRNATAGVEMSTHLNPYSAVDVGLALAPDVFLPRAGPADPLTRDAFAIPPEQPAHHIRIDEEEAEEEHLPTHDHHPPPMQMMIENAPLSAHIADLIPEPDRLRATLRDAAAADAEADVAVTLMHAADTDDAAVIYNRMQSLAASNASGTPRHSSGAARMLSASNDARMEAAADGRHLEPSMADIVAEEPPGLTNECEPSPRKHRHTHEPKTDSPRSHHRHPSGLQPPIHVSAHPSASLTSLLSAPAIDLRVLIPPAESQRSVHDPLPECAPARNRRPSDEFARMDSVPREHSHSRRYASPSHSRSHFRSPAFHAEDGVELEQV